MIDEIWTDDRVPQLQNPVFIHSVEYAGLDYREKLKNIQTEMINNHADYLFITKLDDIAWTLNLRGDDIPYNPLFYAYLMIEPEKATIFANASQFDLNVIEMFQADKNLMVENYDQVYQKVSFLVNQAGKITWMDQDRTQIVFYELLPNNTQSISSISPPTSMKTVKNELETMNLVESHKRDSLALCAFFMDLERRASDGTYSELNEYDVAMLVDDARSNIKLGVYKGPSFETIAASGPNAAIVHYAPTSKVSRKLDIEEMLLVDSGGQYYDGTTDVTRTF